MSDPTVEITLPAPTVEAPAPNLPETTTPQPAEEMVTTAIAKSQQAGDKPRETLTKIAHLKKGVKKWGIRAMMGVMAISMLSSVLTPLMADEGSQSGGH